MKKEQSAPPSHHASPSTSTPQTPPELSHASWRTRTTSAPSSPTPLRNASISTTTSDLDFSPATRTQSPSAYPHPVPTSLDNGKTLDWTGSYPEEEKLEKRWPRIGKKKDKEKILPLAALAEQQEHLYHGEPLPYRRPSAPYILQTNLKRLEVFAAHKRSAKRPLLGNNLDGGTSFSPNTVMTLHHSIFWPLLGGTHRSIVWSSSH